MSWVIGIREVRNVEIFVTQPRRFNTGRTPGEIHIRRVVTQIPYRDWGQVLRSQVMLFLPELTGAGPCGTMARCERRGPLAWSVQHLIEPLQEYYAAYEPPLRSDQGMTKRRCVA